MNSLFLNQDEYDRLIYHSSYSKALVEAKKQYDASFKEQGSLLYHLNELSRYLYLNSVNGTGSETSAGAGAYSAIIIFQEYYDKLDNDIKNKIPPAVKAEIDLLLVLSSDRLKNSKACEQDEHAPVIETCIATRRSQLEKAINLDNNRQILEGIGISESATERIVAEKEKQLNNCIMAFKYVLKQNTYQGADQLYLSLDLIHALGVDYSISSMKDLHVFMKADIKELEELCQSASIQQQITALFHDVETLVIFIFENPITKATVLLSHCGQALANKLIKNSADLLALLIAFESEEYCQLMCRTIPMVIYQHLKNIRRLLSSNQCAIYDMIFDIIKFKLYEKINTVIELNYFMEEVILAHDIVAFVEIMKTKLLDIIKDAASFRLIMSSVAKKNIQLTIFKTVEKALPDFVYDAKSLVNILKELPIEGEFLIKIIQPRLMNIIKNARDFYLVMAYLASDEMRSIVFTTMEKALPDFIYNRQSLIDILEVLPPEGERLVKTILPTICKMIEKAKHFYKVMKALSTDEMRIVVLHAIEKVLPFFINDLDSIRNLLKVLPPTAQYFIEIIQPKFVNIIIKEYRQASTATVLIHMLCASPFDEIRWAIVVNMKELFLDLINDVDGVRAVINQFSGKRRDDFLMLIQTKLPDMVRNIQDFIKTMRFPLSQTIILKMLKEVGPNLIHTIKDLVRILNILNKNQCLLLLEGVQPKLVQLIKHPNHLEVFNVLGKEKSLLVRDFWSKISLAENSMKVGTYFF